MRFSDPNTQERARARRVFRDQPCCKGCGEKGCLRFDDDCDLYVLCDVCGHEYDS